MKYLIIALIAVLSTESYSQSISSEIDGIYNFQPSKLSDEERKARLPALDAFWEKAKRDTLTYLPQLRLELQREGHNPFFYYDGAGLLITLSDSRADKETAVGAIAKCDLADISQKVFVLTLNSLASEGINVTKAAVMILKDPNFAFLLPQHAMKFNQGLCLTYMLLPQKSYDYIDTLVTLFPTVNSTSQKSIITTL